MPMQPEGGVEMFDFIIGFWPKRLKLRMRFHLSFKVKLG